MTTTTELHLTAVAEIALPDGEMIPMHLNGPTASVYPLHAAQAVMNLLGLGWTSTEIAAALSETRQAMNDALGGLAALAALLDEGDLPVMPERGPDEPSLFADVMTTAQRQAKLTERLGPIPADKVCSRCDEASISTMYRWHRGPDHERAIGRMCGDCWARYNDETASVVYGPPEGVQMDEAEAFDAGVNDEHRRALVVDCIVCSAQDGHWCTTASGWPRYEAHEPRLIAAGIGHHPSAS